MSSDLQIRPERASDGDAVRAVNTDAFGRVDEARLVARLREFARPYVGLVAADGDDIVGHIV
jgi:predicted N-acetyltransferase YhbS